MVSLCPLAGDLWLVVGMQEEVSAGGAPAILLAKQLEAYGVERGFLRRRSAQYWLRSGSSVDALE